MNAPNPIIRCLFDGRGWQPHDFQLETWRAYAEGKSGLLHAPTGTGKTLAFLIPSIQQAAAAKEKGSKSIKVQKKIKEGYILYSLSLIDLEP